MSPFLRISKLWLFGTISGFSNFKLMTLFRTWHIHFYTICIIFCLIFGWCAIAWSTGTEQRAPFGKFASDFCRSRRSRSSILIFYGYTRKYILIRVWYNTTLFLYECLSVSKARRACRRYLQKEDASLSGLKVLSAINRETCVRLIYCRERTERNDVLLRLLHRRVSLLEDISEI